MPPLLLAASNTQVALGALLPAFLSTSQMQPGLAVLLEAFRCAQDANSPPWDFAMEHATLRAAGLSATHLRWLISKGYLEHAIERPTIKKRRSVRRVKSLEFRDPSCFVLTDVGAEFAASICQPSPTTDHTASTGRESAAAKADTAAEPKPRWNAERRELTFDGSRLIKFKRVAINLQVLLSAFEKAGWARWIENPFAADADCNPKTRQHNAINSLNRHQRPHMLQFSSDGTAGGAEWRAIPQRSARRRTPSKARLPTARQAARGADDSTTSSRANRAPKPPVRGRS